jgi:steroid 5-alpha reductase family enzyme
MNDMIEPVPWSLVLTAYLAMVIFMTGLWVIEGRVRNASVGDVGWCLGLIGVVFWYSMQATGEISRKMLVALLVVLYAGRLGLYVLTHRVIGTQEDARYRRLRERWGAWVSVKMFGYFQLQALAVAAFSLPFLVIIRNPRPPFDFTESIGLLIWTAAIFWETRADRQLAQFRADPRNHNRVCREGLWRYSRHPNYFFEWLHWWAYVVMAIGTPDWLLTWIGPVGMGVALIKITGIPWAEEQALQTRGDAYRRYQKTTNAFVPWFPRRTEGH